ncbi:MAG TPA: discoidin domain-containing protein, partial [Puia sp.]|nr:discoidin domain-containing protein [Puia sp.]
MANDGDVTTRWSSNGDPLGNNAYLTIDLGANYDICKVLITWETAYGKDFKLQVAMQGVDTSKAANWTTFDSETNFAGGNNVTFEFDGAATGRYVRMQGVTAGTGFGYSIWDMQVFGTLAALCATPSSLTATNVTENTATLNWSAVSGATSYIVKYGPTIVSSQITRTITTPTPPANALNISALSCNGYTYNYSVQAVCGVNNSAVSPQSGFSTDNCSVSCVGVGNRFASADIGDIGIAGRTCMNGTNYVLTGSGAGIGGVDDQFQFAWLNDANTNEEVSGQILTPAPSQGLIGLMIRDSITNTSRYAFVGINVATNKFVFMYRSSPSGPVTTIIGPTAVFNSFVKIDKLGTNFKAFYSPDGGTTWIQIGTVGSQVNLNFGTSHGIAYG